MDLEIFKNMPFFTTKDFEAFTQTNHSSIYLTKLKKKGDIIPIEKGKYTFHEDPLIYASNIIYPSYISGLSALYYYNLTTQIPLKVLVITTHIKRDNSYITFIQTPQDIMFGYEKIMYKNFEIFMVTKEKLLLDALHFQKLGVSISDLYPLLQENLNTHTLIKYLHKIGNISLIKRAGYLLEQYNIDVYDSFKHIIQQDKNYIKLEQNLPKTKIINSKWRININI